jgi:predicted membrane-bound spermidine synthase
VKIAYWKKLLSYVADIKLEKKQSNYSGELDILLSNGRVALCTKNATYSFDDLYINFRDSFSRIDISKFKIDKVLLLGAGLLSVPYILEKRHHKIISCKAVDIDPAVLESAEKYTKYKLKSDIELICADAAEFVKKDCEKYDLIIVDVFIDDTVPSQFETEDFLKSVKNLLMPDGLLMFNRMAQNENALIKTEIYYNQLFSIIFNDSKILQLKSNRMLIAINDSKNRN